MQKITLNNGLELPMIGFGTYKSTKDDGVEAVKFALQNGYQLIDTAAFYKNEEAVGEGIKQSGIARKDIIVTTKIWRECLGYESTKKEFELSLQRLGLSYIDLYLIHWPANTLNYDNWQKANADTWRAMEELQAEGKIKSIGVSNFWPEHFEALLQTAKVVPAVNQIEFHPGYWQPEVVEYCMQHDIVVEAWSPLARGRVFNSELLQQLATKYDKSIAQVCLRWMLQHNVIVIPKSTTNQRIIDNLDVFDFEISASEMKLIDELPEMGFSGELPNNWPAIL